MKYILAALISAICLSGCGWFGHEKPHGGEVDTWSKVMILYSAGFNSLSSSLSDDIEDLAGGELPGEKDDKAVIVVSHLTKNGQSSYLIPTHPQIIRLYRDKKSRVVRDTLMTLPATELLTMPSVMEKSLKFIQENFKSEHYGLILSSHATGWLPSGYYTKSNQGTSWYSRKAVSARKLPEGAVPYIEEVLPGPAVKSFGQELYQETVSSSSLISYEMELPALAASIPMHLDYLLFDACLMGCVEVAYELKDIADYIGFSPAEVLSEGLDYRNITLRLVMPKTADPMAVCEDYYNYYDAQGGEFKSATISYIDCRKLDALAAVCKDLFAAHREDIKTLNPSDVQGYFRFNKHWFYDLEDILVKAKITESEKTRLKDALSSCVLYNECTSRFISIDIATHCGFSMYLPCNGSASLDTFYKTLAWNRATGLVE